MASPTDVANMALQLLGLQRIEDLDEATGLGNLAKTFYAPARNALLAMTDWPFATGWAKLTQLSETPISDWNYQYSLPADPVVVAMWELSDADSTWTRAFDPVTKLQVVYTDYTATTVGARCTFELQDTGQWNPLAIQALAYKMAADMAHAKTGQTAKFNALMQAMQLWINQATAKDGKQRAHDVVLASNFTRIRT